MVQADGADGPPPESALVENETVKNDCEKFRPGDSDLAKPADMEIVKSKKEKEKAKENLTKLGAIVENECEEMPSEADSSKFLQEMDELKLKNEESKLLGILDTIINMTKEGKLVNQDINQKIPDSIVVTVQDGEHPTEYICAQVTKKWIMYRFQISEQSNFSVELKTKHLVQITDRTENTCDVMGLVLRHSSSFQRNRIIPEYYVKNEKLSTPGPSTVGDYSSFKGACSTRKRGASSKPHTPQQKVSN